MTKQFHVDPERLDHIVSRLAGLAGFMAERFAELDRRVAGLHEGSWSGQAADAHAQAHREWSAGAGEFADGVADMRAAAAKAHRHYISAVAANTTMFGSR